MKSTNNNKNNNNNNINNNNINNNNINNNSKHVYSCKYTNKHGTNLDQG